MQKFRSKSTDRLFEAIMQLETLDECYDFFEDICTIKEIQDLSQRLDTAFLLDEGLNYGKISQEVGVSTATISRVSKCLNYGSGGYRNIIDRFKGKGENQ